MRIMPGRSLLLMSLLAAAFVLQLTPIVARAEDSAKDILQTAMAKYEERMAGVEDYTVVQSMAGIEQTLYFERVESDDGRTHFRQVAYAGPMPGMEGGMMGGSHMQGGQMQGGQMQGSQEVADDLADPYRILDEIAGRAKLQGTEKLDGHEAYVISVDDLSGLDFGGLTRGAGAGNTSEESFQPETAKIWIDTDRYVMLGFAMTGTLKMQGKASDITFNARMSDYREIQGILHPFRTEVAVEGMMGGMTAEQREELKKAKEEMEKQLKEMNEQQRAMVEGMMKDRLADLEAMAGPGPMTVAVEVKEVRVNQGPPETESMPVTGQPEQARSAEPAAEPGIPLAELTPKYLEGDWCAFGRERALFRFYKDGSWHSGFAEQGGVDRSAPPHPYETFLESFNRARIADKSPNSFRMMLGGEEIVWTRNCDSFK